MPVEAALGDPEPLAEPVDAQRIRAAVGEQGETGLNPVADRKPASGAARRGHARQHTTTSNVTPVKISSGKESRPEVLLQPWPPVVTAAHRLLHPARPAGGTPRCRYATTAASADKPYHTAWYGRGFRLIWVNEKWAGVAAPTTVRDVAF